ncbi:hypothetical protein L7F22_007331 [Adiantum nelumboides]|nr:hypothetical protein [Adiantum nelumboides]
MWKHGVPQGFGVHHVLNPNPYRGVHGSDGKGYAEDVADLISSSTPGKVAGFIAKTIQPLLEFETQGVIPDIVTVAKGIGNGLPLVAVVTTLEIASTLSKCLHFDTFGGNPICSADGHAIIKVIDKEKRQENCAVVGNQLLEQLLHESTKGVEEQKERAVPSKVPPLTEIKKAEKKNEKAKQQQAKRAKEKGSLVKPTEKVQVPKEVKKPKRKDASAVPNLSKASEQPMKRKLPLQAATLGSLSKHAKVESSGPYERRRPAKLTKKVKKEEKESNLVEIYDSSDKEEAKQNQEEAEDEGEEEESGEEGEKSICEEGEEEEDEGRDEEGTDNEEEEGAKAKEEGRESDDGSDGEKTDEGDGGTRDDEDSKDNGKGSRHDRKGDEEGDCAESMDKSDERDGIGVSMDGSDEGDGVGAKD